MSFRLVNPLPQFFTVDGKVLAGGNLYFTDSGTSNPRPTYADPSLSAENTNPVILDASGRPNADIWLTGVYRVVLKDATGATIWTRDDVKGPADLPGLAGNEGYFLGTDGETMLWKPVLQVPATVGQSGKVLTNDGDTPFWAAPAGNGIPALVPGKYLTNADGALKWDSPPVPSASGSGFQIGNFLVQTGTATATVGNLFEAAYALIFPTPFATCIGVWLSVTTNGVNPYQSLPCQGVHSVTPTGAAIRFNLSISSSNGNWHFNTPINFTWLAMGTL